MSRFVNLLLVGCGPNGDCWDWTGIRNGPKKPYGRFFMIGDGPGAKLEMAHRVSYEHFVGSIPEGLHIDHLCMRHQCVNPSHLEPVTLAENNTRWAKTITHCVHGHPRDGVKKDGKRYCKECSRQYSERWRRMKETA